MRVTYDTEFLEDGRTIDLISIALVREDGSEYYAIVDCGTKRDGVTEPTHMDRAVEHPWLRKNVVTSLPVDFYMGGGWYWDLSHPDADKVKPLDQIRQEVLRFLMGTPALSLWAWYAAYDHVALAQLFGRMIDMPIGIPMWTNDIRQECARLGDPLMPEQPSGNHNALEDARFNLVRMLWLDEAAKREKK